MQARAYTEDVGIGERRVQEAISEEFPGMNWKVGVDSMGKEYFNIDERTFLLIIEEPIPEEIAVLIREVTVVDEFSLKGHVGLGLYKREFGIAAVDNTIICGMSHHKYRSWRSRTVEDAFNLYNGVRAGKFKPAKGCNWEVGDSTEEPGGEDAPSIASVKKQLDDILDDPDLEDERREAASREDDS